MIPSEVTLLQLTRQVRIRYPDATYTLDGYTLRCHSPSAEHRHAPKPVSPNVTVTQIEPVGNYAVKFIFDDGHRTGLYRWEWLRELCTAHGKSQ